MADLKISELAERLTLADTDEVAIEAGGTTYKTNWGNLKSLLEAELKTIVEDDAATMTVTTADGITYTVALNDNIATHFDAGDSYKLKETGQKLVENRKVLSSPSASYFSYDSSTNTLTLSADLKIYHGNGAFTTISSGSIVVNNSYVVYVDLSYSGSDTVSMAQANIATSYNSANRLIIGARLASYFLFVSPFDSVFNNALFNGKADIIDFESIQNKQYEEISLLQKYPFTQDFDNGSAATESIRKAFYDIKLFGCKLAKKYGVVQIERNNSSVWKIVIKDEDGNYVATFYESGYTQPTGIATVKLEPVDNSGISGVVMIDWSLLSANYLEINSQNYTDDAQIIPSNCIPNILEDLQYKSNYEVAYNTDGFISNIYYPSQSSPDVTVAITYNTEGLINTIVTTNNNGRSSFNSVTETFAYNSDNQVTSKTIS